MTGDELAKRFCDEADKITAILGEPRDVVLDEMMTALRLQAYERVAWICRARNEAVAARRSRESGINPDLP